MDQLANPMGIDGFEFVEFAAEDSQPLRALFTAMGFVEIARHRERPISLFRQGHINFLLNESTAGFAARFTQAHGPSAPGFAIRVADADAALAMALERGAEAAGDDADSAPVDAPAIKGIGGANLFLVDGDAQQCYADYVALEGVDQNPKGFGLTFIDHLTHNVFFGNMEKWANYYEQLFNFREIRYFDIKGSKTGLVSKAMTAPDGRVRIPLNESSDEKSQINEYLDEYKGEGIQHIALFTDDIYRSIERMREHGVTFLNTTDTYYEVIDQRIPGHGEDVSRMKTNRILIDADPETHKQLLLQIFTVTNIGPIFFEIIQRKGNEGFGEGNFQALFEAIERDQEQRGVL